MRNLFVILGLSIPLLANAATDVMQGFPPKRENQAHMSNALTPPYSHWAMHNPGQIYPSQRIPRAGEIVPLPTDIMYSLGDVEIAPGKSFKGAFENHYADGVVVLHKGTLVYEAYFNGMQASDHHIWYSMTKSIVSAAFGILVEQGKVDLDKSPADYIPELKGSGFERTSIRHVLDHMSALAFKENYTDPASEFIRFYAPALNMFFMPGARDAMPHKTPILGAWDFAAKFAKPDMALLPGEAFDYNSTNADVLGWLIARLSGLNAADFIEAHIWSKLGVEHDAAMIVDRALMPVSTGGMLSTLRDAARFGQMVLQRGQYNGQQVLPASWMDEITDYDPLHMEAMAANPIYQSNDWVAYHNMWWQLDKTRGEFAATGIHGQVIYINREAQTVVAYFSSQPKASAARNPNYQTKLRAARTMADYLSAE
jgi:CubicO group peptidase (beta-lactamase class C family)